MAGVRCKPEEAGQLAERGAEAGVHLLQGLHDTQAPERDDILNIGGFSDAVFQRCFVVHRRRRRPIRP